MAVGKLSAWDEEQGVKSGNSGGNEGKDGEGNLSVRDGEKGGRIVFTGDGERGGREVFGRR